MNIENNILKYYLRNCYFTNGTAYAGKSTMCAMLAQRYDMIHCQENYNLDLILSVADPGRQPNICYMNTMPSWQHFVSRAPEEYEAWVDGNSRELAGFEVAELIRISSERKVIVDTNIPCDLLWQVSEATLRNFQACIARVNSPERYRAFAQSGFFTLTREDSGTDTREEMLSALAAHFNLP